MTPDTRQLQFLQDFLHQWHEGTGIKACTSGTTGAPKEITLSMVLIKRSASRTNQIFGITRKSRLHSAISFEFIGGKMMIARSLLAGCDLTFSEPSISVPPPEEGKKIDLMAVVPAQIESILSTRDKFSFVNKYLVGGCPVPDDIWNRIVESGINAWESYGMTETASHIALRRIAGNGGSRPKFIPLPGVDVSLTPYGCLMIKDGDNVVETNDIASIYSDGSFEIIGRKDDIINTGGIKVQPQNLETILRPYLSEILPIFYISSLPDRIWSSRLVLVGLFPESKDNDNDSEQILQKIRETLDLIPANQLPKKLRPKQLVLTIDIPITKAGKPDRKKLLKSDNIVFSAPL